MNYHSLEKDSRIVNKNSEQDLDQSNQTNVSKTLLGFNKRARHPNKTLEYNGVGKGELNILFYLNDN